MINNAVDNNKNKPEISLSDYLNYITSTHNLYDRYRNDWRLCINSYHGGPEYKDAHYLRAYQVDFNTPSEMVNTYERADDGSYVAKFKAKVTQGATSQEVSRGQDKLSGSFYEEKLDSVPWYNYVKLITSEYNSILFRNPPQRYLGDQPEMDSFVEDVDGAGNSLGEFMSQVDVLTTVYGVLHIGCYKPIGSDVPKFKIHTPEDVTNWSYRYNPDGTLALESMVIRVEASDYHSVFRVLTDDYIDTIFIGNEDNEDGDYVPPVDSPDLENLEDGTYRIRQENELGYIPVVTVYQNVPVYNNVGSTIIMDVAQIQRSVYGDNAEIYSAITYSTHPTLVIDENTDQLNDGQVNAEPGGICRVQGGLTGDNQNYVFEFVSPSLDNIREIRELIDSKLNKLTQIAMLRSEDLIKASNSGEQIEIYDDKLAALIRKKATNLENTEAKLFNIYFDWTNQQRPDDFRISYSRQYNKRALETELKEIDTLMGVVNKYDELFRGSQEVPEYATEAEAIAEANRLGGTGAHSHEGEDGSTIYMPFATHDEYEAATGNMVAEPEFKTNMRNKIRTRLEELMSSTSTNQGL